MKFKVYVECGFMPHSINLTVNLGRIMDHYMDITQVQAIEVILNLAGEYEIEYGDRLAKKMLGIISGG